MLLKKAVLVLLTQLLLFSDSGMMLYAHTCHKSNKTSFSVTSAKHCCGKPTDTKHCSVQKKSCCSINTTYLKQSFATHGSTNASFAPVPQPAYASLQNILATPLPTQPDIQHLRLHAVLCAIEHTPVFTGVFRI